MSFNFGMLPPPPPPEPSTPADDVRLAIGLVDRKLGESNLPGRMFFSPREVQDLLLDVRNTLERFTSPAYLIGAAQQIAAETKGAWEELGETGV